MNKVFVTGGAGFIGQHLVNRLILDNSVVVYDMNKDYIAKMNVIPKFSCKIIEGNINDTDLLYDSMQGCDVVFHLASNADIAKAVTNPFLDFSEGTLLTQRVLEAARITGVNQFYYFSGSGVYGEAGLIPTAEDYGPTQPISTYGASKLAGEALVSSYCHMFGIKGLSFRMANVVGSGMTHGVVKDFVERLKIDPTHLHIMGDGSQSKSYIHVDDVVRAVYYTMERTPKIYDVYNVATDDYITVLDIVQLVLNRMKITGTKIIGTTEDRGWRGDVPVVRFDLHKIHELGWSAMMTSVDAIKDAIQALL